MGRAYEQIGQPPKQHWERVAKSYEFIERLERFLLAYGTAH